MWNPFKSKAEVKTGKRNHRPRYTGARNLDLMNLSLAGDDSGVNIDNRSIEQIITEDLARERGKLRTLEHSNAYASRWFSEIEENVVSSNGFRFQSLIKRSNGDYNKPVNDQIEAWWKIQCKAENYTVQGQHSGLDATSADKLILRMVARDGFCLVRMVDNFDNETGFSIQILPGEIVDHRLCTTLDNGNKVHNGVEVDEWTRVVAYHLVTKDKNGKASKQRLNATDIICPFKTEQVGQYLGLPWARSVVDTLHGLDQYEEAVLKTAREAACKGLHYLQDLEKSTDGDIDIYDIENEELYPGMNTLLPPGITVEAYDPKQPQNTYNEYRSGLLQRASSGLGISYQSLSGDLSQGNYSSQRVGMLSERESFKGLQNWFIQAVKVPIFKRALRMGRMTMNIPAGLTFDDLLCEIFIGRRWNFVDPQKEIKAATMAVEAGFISREKVIADMGSNLDEEGTLREIARGVELAKDLGLVFPTGVDLAEDEEDEEES